MADPRRYLVAPANSPAQEVVSAFHPCDDMPPQVVVPAVLNPDGTVLHPAVTEDPEPLYRGPREDVIDVDADPDNPVWLRYRGLISDETYDRLKAEGLIDLVEGRVAVLDRINEPGAVQK